MREVKGGGDRITEPQKDIETNGLNQPKGWFSEKDKRQLKKIIRE